jgi:hypothetical protein
MYPTGVFTGRSATPAFVALTIQLDALGIIRGASGWIRSDRTNVFRVTADSRHEKGELAWEGPSGTPTMAYCAPG